MAIGYQQMLDEADAKVTSVDAADMAEQLGAEDIVMVDIRDPRELEREGMIPDAFHACLLYTSPSPRDLSTSRMPSSA